MTIALPVLLLVIFLVWVILSIARNEASATQFWWNLLIALGVLAYFGAGHLGSVS